MRELLAEEANKEIEQERIKQQAKQNANTARGR